MFIEVHEKGKLLNRITVSLPVIGFDVKSYQLRKAIVDLELEKARKVYPYAQLILAYESRMNKVNI